MPSRDDRAWTVEVDPDSDALICTRTAWHQGSSDLVTADFGVEIAIGRDDPSEILSVAIGDWSRRHNASIPLLGRLVGDEMEALAWQMARLGASAAQGRHQVDARDERQEERLQYLVRLVNRENWDGARRMNIAEELEPLLRGDFPGDPLELGRLTERVLEDGSGGRAATRIRQFAKRSLAGGASLADQLAASGANLIPASSDETGPCRSVLLAFCFDGDSFGATVNECLLHVGIRCPLTEVVVLITSKWDPNAWGAAHSDVALSRAAFVVLLATPGRSLLRVY